MELQKISGIAQQFDSLVELQSYCNSQYKALEAAHKKLREQEHEIDHLKAMIVTTQPLLSGPQTELIVKSSEQAICEMEIERLKQTSMQRSLTLEETKRLDLVVKNLLLSKGQYKDITPDYKKLPPGLTEDTLAKIASAVELVPEENNE